MTRRRKTLKYPRSVVGWTPCTPEGLRTCRLKIEERLTTTTTLTEAKEIVKAEVYATKYTTRNQREKHDKHKDAEVLTEIRKRMRKA